MEGIIRFCATFYLLACMTSSTLTWMMSEVIMIKSLVALIAKIGSF